jgi:hypothetical protein
MPEEQNQQIAHIEGERVRNREEEEEEKEEEKIAIRKEKVNDSEAQWLKIAFISLTIVLALSTWVTGLPPVIGFVALIVAGPVWNIIDGFGFISSNPLKTDSDLSKNERAHKLFDYLLLGIVGFATIIVAIVIEAQSGMAAATSSVGLQVLMGPIGCSVFAITMFCIAIESYQEGRKALKEAHNNLAQNPDNPAYREAYKQAYEKCTVDTSAWTLAGIGATVMAFSAGVVLLGNPATASILASIAIGIFIGSATIKLFQITGLSAILTSKWVTWKGRFNRH